MTEKLEVASRCLLCGSPSLAPRRRYRTKTKHGRAIFGETWLHECQDCGLVQSGPCPTLQQLADYYAVDYRNGCFAGADVADLSQFPLDNLFYYNRGQSIAELVAPYLTAQRSTGQSPRILDIGAGYGHILHALGERFPTATRTAIEFSEVCVTHLRSLGITVHAEPAETVLPRLNEQFDLIVLSHVLEHLLDPQSMLQMIHERLAPGGLLYIEVPHIPAEAVTDYIDSVWAPRFDEPHITFFSPQPLTRLLQQAGFAVPFCDTAGLVYKRVSRLAFEMPHWRWFLQRVMPRSFFHFLRRQRLMQPLKVKTREDSFYQYGGFRIWIRSISQKPEFRQGELQMPQVSQMMLAV